MENENLQVFLRFRPFTTSERRDKTESQGCVSVEGLRTVVLKAPTFKKKTPRPVQRFTLTQVFGPDCGQKQMFDGTARHLVVRFLEGRNSLVFTYGATNAGKTFTFLGPHSDLGLLPRSLAFIFNSIEGRVFTECSVKPNRFRDFTRLNRGQQEKENTAKIQLLRLVKKSDVPSGMSSLSSSSFLEAGSSVSGDSSVVSASAADGFCLDADPNTQFSVWVSFCEIYNENIHDLLEQLPSSTNRRTVLQLSQDVEGNSFVKDLHWVQVNTSDEAYRVMKAGKKKQSVFSTNLNQMSSRSHSIFSIRILRIDDESRLPRVHTISELSLCDLAGSESCARAGTGGERLKEAGNINMSLLALGKCMKALRHNQRFTNRVPQVVPFRESKLTHFLQGYFTGGGNACMIVNVSPCDSAHDETLNVLKFSAIAQKVHSSDATQGIDALWPPASSIGLEDVEDVDEEEDLGDIRSSRRLEKMVQKLEENIGRRLDTMDRRWDALEEKLDRALQAALQNNPTSHA